MIAKRRIFDYSAAGLLLLLPAAILNASLKSPERLNKFDEAVLRISSPLQAVASWLVEGVGGLWDDYVFLVDVESENDELRRENLALRRQLGQSRRAAAEAEDLHELLDLKQRTAAETVGAHVVASSLNSHFRVTRLRIDSSDAPVEEGMPVLSTDGLVGRILHVYDNQSDVLLLSDTQSSIDVVIPETGGRGLVRGIGRDDSYRCRIEWLELGPKVEKGQRVVTSGLGKYFPAGLLVGTISAVGEPENGMYQNVEVEPAAQLSTLDVVLVLLEPPPPPDPNGDVERASPVAHDMRPL